MNATPDRAQDNSLGRKTLVIDLKSEFDLVCHFTTKGGGWQEKQFSARKNRVQIGNHQQEAQIFIPDGDPEAIQALALKVGECWLIMENGKRDLMTVNGLPRRQAVVSKDCKAAVSIGSTTMVFMAGALPEDKPLLPEGNRALVRFGDQQLAVPVEDQPVFLGTHPACELRLDRLFAKEKSDVTLKPLFDAPFAAVLCGARGRLFITPLGRTRLQLNGQPIEGTVPLPANSTLGIERLSLPIALPENLQGAGDGVPSLREDRFALIHLDEQGRPQAIVALKPSGSSMLVGRSSQSAELVIPVDDVSRKHAQMILYEKNILLEDCYSSNGTFVNDEKIGRCRVRAGDVLRFGSTQQFLLCYATGKPLPGIPLS